MGRASWLTLFARVTGWSLSLQAYEAWPPPLDLQIMMCMLSPHRRSTCIAIPKYSFLGKRSVKGDSASAGLTRCQYDAGKTATGRVNLPAARAGPSGGPQMARHVIDVVNQQLRTGWIASPPARDDLHPVS